MIFKKGFLVAAFIISNYKMIDNRVWRALSRACFIGIVISSCGLAQAKGEQSNRLEVALDAFMVELVFGFYCFLHLSVARLSLFARFWSARKKICIGEGVSLANSLGIFLIAEQIVHLIFKNFVMSLDKIYIHEKNSNTCVYY